LDAHKIYSIDSLVTFNSSIKIIDSLSNDQDLNQFSISKKALIFAHHHFQKMIGVAYVNEKMAFPKKVLVLRKGKVRGLIDRENIKNYCVANGYHTIYPEDESVKAQIGYFFTANDIVLEGGAAMANLIFCKEGTKITYLCSNITQNYRLVSTICNLLGLRLEVIVGESVPKINFRATSIYDIFHSSYQIKSNQLKFL
jgi:capsular polysaccharide biosynthesis protein